MLSVKESLYRNFILPVNFNEFFANARYE